jgi:DNA (cytosine-5)-methyltransferase 1
MDTVTTQDHHALVGVGLRPPVVAPPRHHTDEVRAFLIKYYGTDGDPQLTAPLHTVTTKHRFGLVTVEGELYHIADIGMRMLVPRELFRAQSFPDTYRIDGLSKTAQVRMCGNSVAPVMSRALAAAQFSESADMAVVA